MQLQPIFAEDFGGLYVFFGSLWLILSVLCIIGLFAAHRGHWSVLLLSGPAILASGLETLSLLQHPRGVLPIFAITVPIPLLLGLAGVVLWFIRNRSRFNPISLRIIFYLGLACVFILILTIVLVTK
jgi:hypothetical protein